VLTGMMDIDTEKAMANEHLWAFIGIGQAVLLNIIAIIMAKFRQPLTDVWIR